MPVTFLYSLCLLCTQQGCSIKLHLVRVEKRFSVKKINFIFILVGFSLVFMSCSQKEDIQRTVSVSGRGAVQVVPDQAVLELSVVTWNASVSKASEENALLMSQVQSALESKGVTKDSYSTSNYSIRRDMSYVDGRSVPGDYIASNVLNVVLSDITKVGEIIDVAISAGANELSSLSFTVSDSSPYMEEARRLAVEQARSKAEVLAETAGAKLGRVMQITEQSYAQPLYKSNFSVMADATAATPVQAGKQDITVSVNVLYELQ